MLVDEAVGQSHAYHFDDDKEKNNENLKIFNGVSLNLVKKRRENNKYCLEKDSMNFLEGNRIENNNQQRKMKNF